jgi:SprT-like family protein
MNNLSIIPPYGGSLPATRIFTNTIIDPTKQISEELSFAFDFFNERLFHGRLRRCLVTLQRHRGAGYFAAQRYETRDGTIVVDEIALNPAIFHERSVTDIFSTLVHEQVHALQFQYGHPSLDGYHNKEWGDWMERIGLIPSHTGAQGGRRTGVRMSHYIQPHGPFAQACAELVAQSTVSFVDRWSAQATRLGIDTVLGGRDQKRRKSKVTSKTRFNCPGCKKANAWGRPDLLIDCRPCRLPMTAS